MLLSVVLCFSLLTKYSYIEDEETYKQQSSQYFGPNWQQQQYDVYKAKKSKKKGHFVTIGDDSMVVFCPCQTINKSEKIKADTPRKQQNTY